MEAGTLRELRLDGGVIRYREVGTGPVLFFVHGILANGTLWRDVVASSRAFVPEDGPGQLAQLIHKYFDEVMTRPHGGSSEEVFSGD